MPNLSSSLPPDTLADALEAARARLDALADCLAEDGWLGPCAPTLNPPLWEYGHVVWFQEHWCLRRKPGRTPDESPLTAPLADSRMDWADWRYNSSRIPHAARWQVPLPAPGATRAWGREVLDAVQAKLAGGGDDPALRYFCELCLHHENMHVEAWWMMWQSRGLRPPAWPELPLLADARPLRFGAERVTLGSPRDAGFVFDNEKWAHPVTLAAFEIDARPVTNAEYARYVAEGGTPPEHWRAAGGGWELRRFERWVALPAQEPVMHVSRAQAEAYALAAGRRLPVAAEWQLASERESFVLGRCWEWTADSFAPYPGFSADPYADYSQPWFDGRHAEVRGAGSWVTDARLARPTFRNFYTPERHDPFIGFRTARSL
jgi:iron(II)-dependent oxidoreductase